MVGETLDDRYRILAKLGEGGMGEVYLVDNLRLGRREALKIVRADHAGDADILHRFRREGRAAGRLNHPNIVAVHDLGQLSDGTLFLTMEFVEGPTVAQVLSGSDGLPLGEALGILAQLTRAVGHAHQAGVVHRDLKPDNLVLTQRSNHTELLKVLDFGIAKIVAPDYLTTGLTVQGQIFGTPQYMAPEAFSGEPTSELSDLYAIGCIAFELVTGRPPFQGSMLKITAAHLAEPAPAPSATCPELPSEYDELVARCMDKQPQARYPSAAALLEALTAVPGFQDGPLRRAAVTVRPPMLSLSRRGGPAGEEESTEEATFAEDAAGGAMSMAQTGILSAEDLVPVHQTTVRQLCELLLEVGEDRQALQQGFAALREAERERARIDAELGRIEQAALQIEEGFRAEESQLRASMDQLRVEGDEGGGLSPELAAQIEALEQRLAERWQEMERRAEELSERSIDQTATRAAVEDRIAEIYIRLSAVADEALPSFAQHPRIAPIVGRLQSLEKLIQRASADRS